MRSSWTAKFTGTFKRGYKSLDEGTKRRVATAIERLMASSDPRKDGHMLHGFWKGYYSYEIGLQYRLIYRASVERKEIEFLAVGTHKIY